MHLIHSTRHLQNLVFVNLDDDGDDVDEDDVVRSEPQRTCVLPLRSTFTTAWRIEMNSLRQRVRWPRLYSSVFFPSQRSLWENATDLLIEESHQMSVILSLNFNIRTFPLLLLYESSSVRLVLGSSCSSVCSKVSSDNTMTNYYLKKKKTARWINFNLNTHHTSVPRYWMEER